MPYQAFSIHVFHVSLRLAFASKNIRYICIPHACIFSARLLRAWVPSLRLPSMVTRIDCVAVTEVCMCFLFVVFVLLPFSALLLLRCLLCVSQHGLAIRSCCRYCVGNFEFVVFYLLPLIEAGYSSVVCCFAVMEAGRSSIVFDEKIIPPDCARVRV